MKVIQCDKCQTLETKDNKETLRMETIIIEREDIYNGKKLAAHEYHLCIDCRGKMFIFFNTPAEEALLDKKN